MRLLTHLLSRPLLERRIARVGLFLEFVSRPFAERHAFALVRHLAGLLRRPLLEQHAVSAL